MFNSGDPVQESKRWCTQEELETIKTKWITTVKAHATRDEVFALNGAGHIFFLLQRIDAKVCAEIAITLLDHDADVDALVMAIGESGSDSTKGRFARITDEFLDSIGLKERIRARVQQRLNTNVDATTELQAMYKSIVTGKMIYLVDCSEGEPF